MACTYLAMRPHSIYKIVHIPLFQAWPEVETLYDDGSAVSSDILEGISRTEGDPTNGLHFDRLL